MKERTRKIIMKWIALLGVLCYIYPVILTARTLFFKDHGGFFYFLFALVLGFSGFILCVLILEKKLFFGKFFASGVNWVVFLAISSVPPIMTAGFLYFFMDARRWIFEIPVMFLFYFIGLRSFFLLYDEILSDSRIQRGIIILAAAVGFAVFSRQFVSLQNVLWIFVYVFLLITMVCKNQQMLDEAFINGGSSHKNVPESIRTYNTKILIFAFIALVALLNGKKLVVMVLNVVSEMLKQAGTLLYNVLSMIMPKMEQKPMKPPKRDLIDSLSGGDTSQIAFFLKILFVICVILFLYKAGPWLFHSITALFSKLRAAFKKMLRNLYHERIVVEEYTDEIEIIKADKPDQRRKKMKNQVRRVSAGLAKITDPAEKIRFLYGCIIELLKSRGIQIKGSDTTGEICKKSAQVAELETQVGSATAVYNTVRYGDQAPKEAEVSQVEGAFYKARYLLKRMK